MNLTSWGSNPGATVIEMRKGARICDRGWEVLEDRDRSRSNGLFGISEGSCADRFPGNFLTPMFFLKKKENNL